MQYNYPGVQVPVNPAAQQKLMLKRDANFAGLVVLLSTLLLQISFTILFIILASLGLATLGTDAYYGLGNTGFLIVYSFAYCIGLGLPAPVCALVSGRKISPFASLYESENRTLGGGVILILMAGLSVCVLSNFAASYILAVLSEFGIRPPDMPSYVDGTIPSLALNIFVFALLPAILEEMVYRGYILKTLRAYGDRFALVVSSLLFSLMHGNILQVPFAFVVGLTLAFIVIKTGHVWIAAMLHFLNNFMSVILQYADLYSKTQEQSQLMIMLVFSVIGLLGLISLFILFAVQNPVTRPISGKAQPLSAGQRTGVLLLSPAMIISLALSFILMIITTKWGG